MLLAMERQVNFPTRDASGNNEALPDNYTDNAVFLRGHGHKQPAGRTGRNQIDQRTRQQYRIPQLDELGDDRRSYDGTATSSRSGRGDGDSAGSAVKPSKDVLRYLPAEFEPGEWDVICQRGRQNYNHIGNLKLRLLADKYLPQFRIATTKKDKTIVVSAIFDMITDQAAKANGCGFVRKDLLQRRWFEVTGKIAREKIGQSLRDALNHQKQEEEHRQQMQLQLRMQQQLQQQIQNRQGMGNQFSQYISCHRASSGSQPVVTSAGIGTTAAQSQQGGAPTDALTAHAASYSMHRENTNAAGDFMQNAHSNGVTTNMQQMAVSQPPQSSQGSSSYQPLAFQPSQTITDMRNIFSPNQTPLPSQNESKPVLWSATPTSAAPLASTTSAVDPSLNVPGLGASQGGSASLPCRSTTEGRTSSMDASKFTGSTDMIADFRLFSSSIGPGQNNNNNNNHHHHHHRRQQQQQQQQRSATTTMLQLPSEQQGIPRQQQQNSQLQSQRNEQRHSNQTPNEVGNWALAGIEPNPVFPDPSRSASNDHLSTGVAFNQNLRQQSWHGAYQEDSDWSFVGDRKGSNDNGLGGPDARPK